MTHADNLRSPMLSRTNLHAVALAAAALGGCQTGKPELAVAARIVARDLGGTEHAPFAFVDGARAAVLVFTTTDCPIANSYAPELRAICRDYADRRVRFYMVHVDPEITADAARAHATEYDLPGAILLDPDHRLVDAVGATMTPEAAVIVPGGEVVYRGRIDDWWGDLGAKRPRPRHRELRDALAAVLAGAPVAVARTVAIGCDIPRY